MRNPTILAHPLQCQLHAFLNLWKVLVTFPHFPPWILDSGASDHVSGNISSFSSISSPKIPHFITVASGSKVTFQGIGKVSLSPSLNLNSVLYIPHCPYNLISLSQLTRSLNCSVTFTANSLRCHFGSTCNSNKMRTFGRGNGGK